MHAPKKFWFVLVGAVLGMAILACSCGSILPRLPGLATPATLAPLPTIAPLETSAPLPTSSHVVGTLAPLDTSPLLSTDTPGAIATATPPRTFDSLPHSDDFSNADSGWDIYSAEHADVGYINGTYFVISKSEGITSFGEANKFYGDTVLDVDATPVSGSSDDNFSYEVGCRGQDNYDGYTFEVGADGYYAVGYYTGGGETYVSLLPGGDWDTSSAIRQGLATNHMRVTCNGSQLKLEVNGELVFETQDSTFSAGDISLGAATYADDGTPAEVHFDNLMVNRP